MLEIILKSIMKVITDRAANVMKQNRVLTGNNSYGLPGLSTNEPIKLFNIAHEDAIENKKPFYALFQDMTKAFDCVTWPNLERAMIRLRLPESYILLYRRSYAERKNRVSR